MSIEITSLGKKILEHNGVGSDFDKYLDSEFSLDKIPNLTDEDKATKLLKKVISAKGYILGVTDYDSDGLNSAAVIKKALKNKYKNFNVIHNKRKDGNGFNKVLVDKIKNIHDEKEISLIITADHGSASEEAFKELKEYGIKHILVTDHHEIPKDNPPVSADVFINPQKNDNDPKEMCGCFTVFKVLSNLYKDDKDIVEKLFIPCLPHVAIATVSDVMCLKTPYNRLAVRAGVTIMNRTGGLWSLLINKLQLPFKYNYKDIGYKLAPVINTGNRMDQEEIFYSLLTTSNELKQEELINMALKLNAYRKKAKSELLKTTLKSLDHTGRLGIYQILETDIAINGVIASTLGETFNKPVSCFSLDPETKVLSGSVRGILDHVNVSEIFTHMANDDNELFINYGGHKGAGGCGIPLEKYDRYVELFEKHLSLLKKSDKVKDKFILDINSGNLTYSLVDEINSYGPYGKNWEIPLLRGKFKIKRYKLLDKILLLTLITRSGKTIEGTYFYKNRSDYDEKKLLLQENNIITITFEPELYRNYNSIKYVLMINNLEKS